MNILIVGLGLIGGSYAKALKRYTDNRVIGIDADETVIKYALSHGAIDKVADDNDIKNADIVIVSLYPKAAADFINSNADLFKDGAVVTDSCGVKRAIYSQLSDKVFSGKFTFIGAHPMAGKEHSGFDYSDADLYKGASLIITTDEPDSTAAKLLQNLAEQIGFTRCTVCTPERHDKMIAFTSQLPHVLACSYISDPLALSHKGFSAGSFLDVTRVAFINDVMWSELFIDNADHLCDEIDELIKNLSVFKAAIKNEDKQALSRMMIKSRELKEKT